MKDKHDHQFYGTGTVGEKGQIVIPARAREIISIKAGDQFIFFGQGKMLNMMRADELDKFLTKMSEKFGQLSSNLKKFKKESK